MNRLGAGVAAALGVGIGLAACSLGSSQEARTMDTTTIGTITLRSSAFDDGGEIPSRYTCDGDEVSPGLAWEGEPGGTQAFVLIADDPDAGGFIHWLLTDIPGDLHELPEGQGDAIAAPGRNSFRQTGWGGPCPPSGEHRYAFTLYALSEQLTVGSDATADQVRDAMAGKVLGQGTLTGRYTRQR
jgi:Raf kinase inhibitor-like YbhB/YbcL family protein